MPLLEHLIELRRRLLWSVVAFLVCFAGAYYVADDIYYFLAKPLADILREQGNPDPH
ncbi:MAG: twin-arginine translocase subunit TatC, partial [Rhodospirillales bacterium]|nr:twin-arginine translocase subunit TatC [Rhodospirillales bacterium]